MICLNLNHVAVEVETFKLLEGTYYVEKGAEKDGKKTVVDIPYPTDYLLGI
jgi:hypothetical protein